jgi:hypothetical protein
MRNSRGGDNTGTGLVNHLNRLAEVMNPALLAAPTVGGLCIDLSMRLVIPQSTEGTMPMISYAMETSLTLVLQQQ